MRACFQVSFVLVERACALRIAELFSRRMQLLPPAREGMTLEENPISLTWLTACAGIGEPCQVFMADTCWRATRTA